MQAGGPAKFLTRSRDNTHVERTEGHTERKRKRERGTVDTAQSEHGAHTRNPRESGPRTSVSGAADEAYAETERHSSVIFIRAGIELRAGQEKASRIKLG